MSATIPSFRPLRLRILEELAQPDTAASVARRLGLPRQKVNYHLHQLEREGLVELVEERRKRNCVERVVRTTSCSDVVRVAARILTDVVERRLQLADAESRALFFADFMDVLSRLIAKYQEHDGTADNALPSTLRP